MASGVAVLVRAVEIVSQQRLTIRAIEMIDSSVTSQMEESGQKVFDEWLFSFPIKDPYKSVYRWLIQLLGLFLGGEGGGGESAIAFGRFLYVYFILTFF